MYRLAYRLPARMHGVSRRQTTAQLLHQAGSEAVRYSNALQLCLEGERAVHASELNEPLMLWNACWRILRKRIPDALEWEYRHMVLKENMMLLESPNEKQLWRLVDCWMSVRERETESRRSVEQPLLLREHMPGDWKELGNFPDRD